jgi:subtilisin family serine protease
MSPLELIKLTALMERTRGNPEVKIGLIDGPVAVQNTDLESKYIREIPGKNRAVCAQANSTACMHGTFIAGILSGKRNSPAPAICPNCTLLIRPIFAETTSGREHMPSATPLELAAAIIDCIDAGARVINLSLALAHPSSKGEQALEQALNHAMRRGTIVVVAAGNQSTLGSSAITRHPWVIPVVACDLGGRPMNESNLGSSIGLRGLSAPGDSITSLGSEGQFLTLGGTSVAVPFVTGTAALVWSEFPRATAAEIRLALTHTATLRKASVVPPLLDATAAYQILLTENATRRAA